MLLGMTSPRTHLVAATTPAFYHVHTRCVRRAWLCGLDPLTGRSYEHRRAWIEQRILFLARYFSIEVFAYAVMSNHYHLVVHADPTAPLDWTDAEVAERWVALTTNATRSPERLAVEDRVKALIGDPGKVSICRERLGSLSWFMRMLNHPIAYRANREDDCTGHFWESRFKSSALLDEEAVLACMAYVDLNPVRAKIAKHFKDATHTSVRRRIEAGTKDDEPLAPVSVAPQAGAGAAPRLSVSFGDYRQILVRTGLMPMAEDEAGPSWRDRVLSMGRLQRAYGSRDKLMAWFTHIGQHRFRAASLPDLSAST